jgi:hypothetical protein
MNAVLQTYDEARWSGSTCSAARLAKQRSGKTIPQLGEQEKQSCPPLKVSSDIANHPGLLPGTNLGDYVGDDVQFETLEAVEIFRYEHGKPLVKPDHPPLTTMMRRLHDWYLESCRKNGTDSLMLRIKEGHGLIGAEVMPIEFVELFQLFNQEALDK